MRIKSLSFIIVLGLAALTVGPAFGVTPGAHQMVMEPTPVTTTDEGTSDSDEENTPGESPTSGTNTPPTVESFSDSVSQGDTVKLELRGSDADGDDLTYKISGLSPANLGSIKLNGDTVTFTASASKTGTATFTYTADDGQDTSDPGKVTVNVKARQPENRAPSADPVSAGAVTQGKTITFSLFGDDPDGDPLTYRLVKAPPASQGNVTITEDGKVTFVAGSKYAGSVSFTYLVSDGQAESDAATVSLVVEATSNEPEPEPSSSDTAEPTDQPTSSSPSGGESSSGTSSSASHNPTHTTGGPDPTTAEATATAISVPTQVTSGGNGLENDGVDGRDLGMGAVVVGASGLLFLGIRKLTLPEK